MEQTPEQREEARNRLREFIAVLNIFNVMNRQRILRGLWQVEERYEYFEDQTTDEKTDTSEEQE